MDFFDVSNVSHCLNFSVLSIYCRLVFTCCERADLLALVCDVFLCFCHFPRLCLGEVWYLIVPISDL